MTTPVAHIYDGDIACSHWREEDRAINHKCDLGAEEFAAEKMAEFGLAFTATESWLELRDPYELDLRRADGEDQLDVDEQRRRARPVDRRRATNTFSTWFADGSVQ